MNYDIFFARAVASARFLGPSGAASTLGRWIVHANRISRQLCHDGRYVVRSGVLVLLAIAELFVPVSGAPTTGLRLEGRRKLR